MQNNFNISIFVEDSENSMVKAFFKLLILTISGLVILHNSKAADFSFRKDESRISVVVIDPGHGGKDWGATVGKTMEKDIVLDIALRLGEKIKKSYPDIQIVYTRSKDVFVPLHQRAEIANNNDADLFISIHVNSAAQKWVQGTETFVLGQHRSEDNLEVAKKENAVILLEEDYNVRYEGFDPNSSESYIMFELMQDEYMEQSVMFASDIQDQFREKANRIDRSVKMAGLLVLRRTTMPGVLVETGFISHNNERNYLLSDSGKSQIATAVFNAFKTYKSKIEEKSSFRLNSSEVAENIQREKPASPVTDVFTPDSEIFFSIQIMALKKDLEIIPDNFKGETDIFKIRSNDINRYYSGKFLNMAEAEAEKNRIQKKFKSAYVVAFENNKLISIKKALGKM